MKLQDELQSKAQFAPPSLLVPPCLPMDLMLAKSPSRKTISSWIALTKESAGNVRGPDVVSPRAADQMHAERKGQSVSTVLADYIFENDKLFAYVKLTDSELDLQPVLRVAAPGCTYARLVIYLYASPEVLTQRVKRKDVPGERSISDIYLEQVVWTYEHFFFHYSASDLLVVNTSEISFVHNKRPAIAFGSPEETRAWHSVLPAIVNNRDVNRRTLNVGWSKE